MPKLWVLGAVALGVARCAHPAPTPEKPASSAAASLLPPGCDANLSGVYVHAQNPSYRYAAVDDGGTLVLTVQRPLNADGGAATPVSDGGETRVVLTRAGHAFSGFTLASQMGSERSCALQLPTEAVSCLDAGIRLRTADRQWVGPSCEAPENAPPAQMVEERLVKTGG